MEYKLYNLESSYPIHHIQVASELDKMNQSIYFLCVKELLKFFLILLKECLSKKELQNL